MASLDDDALLEWAAQNGRIVLTHDVATMVPCAFERLDRGQSLAGILHMSPRLPVSEAIEELLLVCECSRQEEWTGVVQYLPL